ncbi:hypothetical protein MPDQ_003902 [Monascus purpureus]|uniref:Uncharacterized protein n=1 Tax=Monascus purpureus TaxID=5098 RepID=A0A507QI55_MONPU|nr:hypothetical protein MPDQ_003902 [Monascus purpureus]BDD64409.1 hypothetical protein MAP00_009234 [Monascus purpureus]
MAFNTSTYKNGTTNATPSPFPSEPTILDTLIPGFTFFSRLLQSYLNIDLSSYVPAFVTGACVVAAIRYSTSNLFEHFLRYFVSTAEIRLNDEVYNYLMFWMSQQPFLNRTIKFVAGTKTNSDQVYTYYSDYNDDEDKEFANDDDDDEDNFDRYWAKAIRRDRYKKFRFTPAEGTHYFRYRGRMIAFTRERDENSGARYELNPERLYLSCLGRDATILKELLNEAQRSYVEKDGTKTIIYRGRSSGSDIDWARCMAKSPRPISTVVLDQRQKQDFLDDIKEYLHPRTRRWYSDRGIPYRRGYLFYGPPGTGKTSLCVAVSGLLGLKIYLLNLSGKNIDESALLSLFDELPRRCIVLLEDIDSAGMTHNRDEDTTAGDREESTSNGKEDGNNKPLHRISLSALLNVIDGVAASEGRILVMTTNHVEKLDPALLRPGRVDMSICFGYSDMETIKDLFCSIYAPRSFSVRGSHSNIYPMQSGRSAEPELGTSLIVNVAEIKKGAGLRTNQPDKEKISQLSEEQRENDKQRERILALAAEFASLVPSGELTPAEVQGYLLKNKDRPEDAISGAEEWVQGVREQRTPRRA